MNAQNQTMARAMAVQEHYTDALLRLPRVVGVSVGRIDSYGGQTGTPALVVLVDEYIPNEQLPRAERIPRELEGVPVVVHEVGTLKAS